MTQDDQGKTAEGVYTTTGVVKSVDEAAGKASIAHEPVPSLKWPAMTMTFTESSKGMLKGIKAGDKVRIDFKQKGDTTLIMDIETVK
jgi:Cu(I)/Ag(I) efflux system protein CusF